MPASAYFKPPQHVFNDEIGRKLDGAEGDGFATYHELLRPGEVMYIGLREGNGDEVEPMVVFADNEYYFDAFYRKYDCGMYGRFDVYALPADAVGLAT